MFLTANGAALADHLMGHAAAGFHFTPHAGLRSPKLYCIGGKRLSNGYCRAFNSMRYITRTDCKSTAMRSFTIVIEMRLVIAVIFLIIERFVLIRLIAEILGFVRTVFCSVGLFNP